MVSSSTVNSGEKLPPFGSLMEIPMDSEIIVSPEFDDRPCFTLQSQEIHADIDLITPEL
jgi:hypothetical protein